MDLLPFDAYVASLNRKRNSAAAVCYTPDRDRVLLVEPTYKPHLDLPGGAVEADEAPWQTVTREVREELGLDRAFAAPLVIDYTPTDERFPEGLAWLFDGGTITDAEVAALHLTDPEIHAVGLYRLDELAEHTKPELAARVAVALDVAAAGGLALCENGKRVQ